MAASQQGSFVSEPGSQSSPASTIPFPHLIADNQQRSKKKKTERTNDFKLITVGFPIRPGFARQVVFKEVAKEVQMFPIEHGENDETFLVDTGDLG